MAKMPGLKRAAALPTGPRLYALTREPQRYGPPGIPPPGFVTAKTSASEWPIYWALAHIFNRPTPGHLRDFPYMGGQPIWQFQAFAETGSERATNIDFVVWPSFGKGTPVAIRIQTEFFHNFASNDTQVYDIVQRDRLENGFEVVDLFDQDFMRDKTGSAAIVLCKQAIGLIERLNVHTSGRVQRV